MSDSFSKPGRWVAAALALTALAGVFMFLVKDNTPKGEVRTVKGYIPWKKETLALAETLPVQDGGRVKPLATYAGFKMLGLHGARSMKIEGDDGSSYKLTPIAWLLDSLFRPELAVKLPTFRVDNSAVLEAIGVKPRGKRDRYSYNDLSVGRDKLAELTQSYENIEKDKRDVLQTQTILLSQNVREYEELLGHFAFARNGVLLKNFGMQGASDQRADLSAMLMTTGEIRSQVGAARRKGLPVHSHIQSILDQFQLSISYAGAGPRLLPPLGRSSTWAPTGEIISSVVSGESKNPQAAIQDIKQLENLVHAAAENEAEFSKQLTTLRDNVIPRTKERGEYKHIELEAKYYRANWFLNALVFFILGTLSAFVMWAVRHRLIHRIFTWLTLGFTGTGLILSIIAIAQRCIIMERPPVGNLYETVIFISSAVVLLALIVELLVRGKLALGLAPILGTMLILLARLFEVGDAKDNMDPLVAVLASNFWLTTHVITISLGYSSGLLAAFLSFIYVLMRGLGLDDGNRDLQRSLTRATYGVLCLTLFLSLVGTVLGGIWANYSWGRFWGWDPKENGALLIVLWTLSILHARLGGYLREWSLHFASLFTACVVAFSWWHVNFFSIGLHNYGFTSGKTTIWVFYSIVVTVIIFGVIAMGIEDESKRRKR